MELLVGRSIPRREDRRFLTGAGRFVADLAAPGDLQAAFVRSTTAAATIGAIDTEEASAVPGVVRVLTGRDLAEAIGPLPILTTPDARFVAALDVRANEPVIHCLAIDEVRYVGEPVAVVVATSRAIAEDAAELVAIDYSPLAPVLDAESASGQRPVHASNPDNVALSLSYEFGSVPEDLDGLTVVERRLRVGRHSGVPLEGRGVLAVPTTGGIEVWSSTQIPFQVKRAICSATGWPADEVRVRTPDVGGGFGPKANVYGEEVVIPFLARLLDRSVHWVEDRFEHLTSAAQSRDQVHRTRLITDSEGRIRSFEDDFTVDIGAHNLWLSGVVANTAIHLLGGYRVPAVRVSGRAVLTNKTPTSQYRGAGRPEAAFALERTLDAAARALGITPVEIRRRNLLSANDLPYPRPIPYRDGVDIEYDGRDYAAVLEAALKLLPDDEVAELRSEHAEAGRRVGVGVATFVEATGRGPFETAVAALAADGTVQVRVGTASAGMAHETTLTQIAAETLRMPFEEVHLHSGDTAGVSEALGSFASRTAVVAGGAVQIACERLIEAARVTLAADEAVDIDTVTTSEGGLTVDGVLRSWVDVAAACARSSGKPASSHPAPASRFDGPRSDSEWGGPVASAVSEHAVLEATGRFEPSTVTWTMGAHVVAVSIDPSTGLITVIRYAAVDEAGRPINPAVVAGQIRGGVAQGIGGALFEEFVYDDSGQPTATSFAEYLLPGTGEVPAVRMDHLDAPSPHNRLGLKGVGESGAIPGYAAIAAAVDDALRDHGVEVSSTPIRPSHVRGWLRELGA